ncbi:MAG: V-type ATP synthase subunit F, partial [Deltaproteobacteria bacterium]|nr:V-type ATP synthase subunit F [Deltaproteobacteria bacterium]
MKEQRLVVIASQGLSAGFALAGVPVFEATSGADAALQIERLAERERAGVVLVDETLYRDIPDEIRRGLQRSAFPVVIPVPGPNWTSEASAHEYIVEILR